ncbi:hypothetical protein MGYG_09064 [Nannizzia gypsea CBS 118893]|uniref:Uncharacterized protein n=1 Tax=Arthroderma gypseum (strain ATCC MYA-4604 / CBS 118893) TaxID=535722 RepID=E4UWU0_ARTGP|nr:hypothetical protein MGYG_09064 [Nannizzia gypsea CBS 118893]EFR01793.1 hypothetical protein MGYG_09064 [Nannizzia gypsea CBS 118893]
MWSSARFQHTTQAWAKKERRRKNPPQAKYIKRAAIKARKGNAGARGTRAKGLQGGQLYSSCQSPKRRTKRKIQEKKEREEERRVSPWIKEPYIKRRKRSIGHVPAHRFQ